MTAGVEEIFVAGDMCEKSEREWHGRGSGGGGGDGGDGGLVD